MSGGGYGGIRVKRETFIIMSDRNENEPLVRDASPTVSIRSGDTDPQVQQYCRPKRFRKLSNSSSLLSEIFRHPDTCEDVLRRKIKRANDRDTSKELLEFLRNTSPPAGNAMSSVVEVSAGQPKNKKKEKGKRRWYWPFWRKKQEENEQDEQKRQSLLLLPDSAVAGRTIGGHRHIAISIPIEYAHLDLVGGPEPSAYHRKAAAEPTVKAAYGGTPSTPDRASITVIKPTVEKRKPAKAQAQDQYPPGLLPLIPPLDIETFGSLLAPVETVPSGCAGSASVRLQNPLVSPRCPLLTARPEGPDRSRPLVKAAILPKSPPKRKLHHVGRRRSNLRSTYPGPDYPSIAETVLPPKIKPKRGCPTPPERPVSPKIAAVKSLEATSADTDVERQGEDRKYVPGQEISARRSFHPDCLREAYPCPRYPSFNYLARHGSMLSLSPMRNEFVSDTNAVDSFVSQPGMTCPLCQSAISVQQSSVTPTRSLSSSSASLRAPQSPSSSTTDLSTSSSSLARREAKWSPRRRCKSPHRRSQRRRHHLSRSASHRRLIRQYEDLRIQRDGELQTLLARLGQIEANNERWIQAMVPMFENITRGLLSIASQAAEEAPDIPRGAWRVGGEERFGNVYVDTDRAGVAVDGMPLRRERTDVGGGYDVPYRRDTFGYGDAESEFTLLDANGLEPVMRDLLSHREDEGDSEREGLGDAASQGAA